MSTRLYALAFASAASLAALSGCGGGSAATVGSVDSGTPTSVGSVTVNAVLTQEPVIIAGTGSTSYGVAGTISDVTYTNTAPDWRDGYWLLSTEDTLYAFDWENSTSNPNGGQYSETILANSFGLVRSLSSDRQGNNIFIGKGTAPTAIRFNPSSRSTTTLPNQFGSLFRVNNAGTKAIYGRIAVNNTLELVSSNIDGTGATVIANFGVNGSLERAPTFLDTDNQYFARYFNLQDGFSYGFIKGPLIQTTLANLLDARPIDAKRFALLDFPGGPTPNRIIRASFSELGLDETQGFAAPQVQELDVSPDGVVYGTIANQTFSVFKPNNNSLLSVQTGFYPEMAYIPLPTTRKVVGTGGNFGTAASGLLMGMQEGKPRSYLTWQATTPSTSRLRAETVSASAETHVMTAEANGITQVRYSNDARLFSNPITTPVGTNAALVTLNAKNGKISSVVTYAITRAGDKPVVKSEGSLATIQGQLGAVYDGEGKLVAQNAREVKIEGGKLSVR